MFKVLHRVWKCGDRPKRPPPVLSGKGQIQTVGRIRTTGVLRRRGRGGSASHGDLRIRSKVFLACFGTSVLLVPPRSVSAVNCLSSFSDWRQGMETFLSNSHQPRSPSGAALWAREGWGCYS